MPFGVNAFEKITTIFCDVTTMDRIALRVCHQWWMQLFYTFLTRRTIMLYSGPNLIKYNIQKYVTYVVYHSILSTIFHNNQLTWKSKIIPLGWYLVNVHDVSHSIIWRFLHAPSCLCNKYVWGRGSGPSSLQMDSCN